MVTGGSVDGLVSGMSTSSVISGLMQVEALPQTALKTKVTTQQKVITAYQGINTKMNGLMTAAKALVDPVSWKGATATSSSDAAVATSTATGSSQGGSLTFKIKNLATAHSLVFDGRVPNTTDSVMTGTEFVIKVNGVDKTITTADTSLKGVVDAINKTTDLGVRATAFQSKPGEYALQLTSTTTGKDSVFEIPPGSPLTLGPTKIATAGANAVLSLGTTNPFEVESSTNTFKGLLDGLTVTAAKVQADTDPPITVTVASDTDGIAAKVQAMIDAANSALTDIQTQTKNKSGAIAGGPLAGNSMMSQLATKIVGTVSGGAGELGSLKSIGIELTRNGTMTFNKTTFLAALNADPVKTQSYFAGTADANADGVKDGIADKLAAVATKTTESTTGTLSRLIISGNDNIKDLNKRVSDWDTRLSARQASLQKQFTAMETALGKLRNQSNWLSGQLSSLG